MWFFLNPDPVRDIVFVASLLGFYIGPYHGLSPSSVHLCRVMAWMVFIVTAFEQLPFAIRLYSDLFLWCLETSGTERTHLPAVILNTFDQETASKLRVMAEEVRRRSDGNMSVEDARKHHEAARRMEEYMRQEVAKRLSRSISIGLCNLAKLMVMLKIGFAILKWGISFFSGDHASDHQ